MTLLAQRAMRAGACAFVLGLCLVWVRAGAGPWISDRLSEAAEVGAPPPRWLAGFRWSDAPARTAARRLLVEGIQSRGADVELLLDHSLRARPLYAPTWLARAQLALWQGRPDLAATYAELSTRLWPNRSRHLWRVAMLRIAMGDLDAAFRALRAHQRGKPSGMERVLWIAEQIEPDADRLFAELAPDPGWDASEADSYLTQLLAAAIERGRVPLARRSWDALSERARAKPYTVRSYVDTLLSTDRVEEAISAWDRYWLPRAAGGPITNPSFEEPPALGGLGWILYAVQGAGWTRDRQVRFDGSYSLRIWFDSSEDLDYRHAFQWVRVEPGRRYRLTGRWRGVDITTSSGPYLEVVAPAADPPIRARCAARIGSWEWRAFEMDFRAPRDTRLVKVRVRRDRARGLARGVSGNLWIDDLALLPLAEGALDG